ncbi:hypothetical protein FC83_GL000562 [Agrilactobacillus composti DSM 18527 = JCM 14202]|uniref:Uncharacterized protein n=1 Tax=Agrilactobacillus composti DSM 18527 = JCM 14202 TaxID=1423734 RepID=X0PH24_9LACO|nr:hypothetical protein [Agrilactobacillus composti]KRM31880.1 hypothetical protein FC83_GL000562 [Agrilactobacillus composti DSM 18527 = JCM 14202]GAF41263.1 hypothetical protein JCM14202_3193 [Agrilactobacillus composti DSM 18527 = JCM 14202]
MFLLFIKITAIFTALGLIPLIYAGAVLIKNKLRKRLKWLVITAIILFAVFGIIFYVQLPPQTLLTLILWNLTAFTIMAALGALFLIQGELPKINVKTMRNPTQRAQFVNQDVPSRLPKFVGLGIGLLVLTFAASALLNIVNAKSIANTVVINAKTNIKAAPMPEISPKSKEIPVANSTTTIRNQMQNSLSNVPNSNVYSLDHLRAQLYHGHLSYVAPLDFDGSFFRYLHYKKVDGYFLTDATKKDASPKFVNTAMYYTPSAYFAHDAKRRLYAYTSGHNLRMDGNAPQLEVNEAGRPYYVVSLYKAYGLTNKPNYGKKWVATMDAKTGVVKLYTVKNKPKWLDVAIDPTLASWQLASWGSDRNGWWNAHGFGGSQSGVMQSVSDVGTEGEDDNITPIAYKNKIYYFASMTSVNRSQTSVLGYTYVDAATGATHYYKENDEAMTPTRANSLAENRMKQTQWKANMPLLYRIDGKPTWVVSMVDENGAFMSYVYLLASGNGTQNTVAVGTDAKQALSKYRDLFSTGIDTASASQSGTLKQFKGTVSRVAASNNTVNFMINDQAFIFNISLNKYPYARFLQANDQVEFSAYVNGNSGTVGSKFTNNTFQVPIK